LADHGADWIQALGPGRKKKRGRQNKKATEIRQETDFQRQMFGLEESQAAERSLDGMKPAGSEGKGKRRGGEKKTFFLFSFSSGSKATGSSE